MSWSAGDYPRDERSALVMRRSLQHECGVASWRATDGDDRVWGHEGGLRPDAGNTVVPRRSRAVQRDSENARIDYSSRRQHAAERELDRIVRKALAEDGRRGSSSTCSATCHERAARPARRTVGHAACPTTLRLAGYWPSRS